MIARPKMIAHPKKLSAVLKGPSSVARPKKYLPSLKAHQVSPVLKNDRPS